MNIIILILEAIICYMLIVILQKKYNIEGLYCYIIAMNIIAIFLSLKKIDINNFKVDMGIIPFISLFLASNIITQKKGLEITKKLTISLLISSSISIILLILTSKLDSSQINLYMNKSFDNIFIDSVRIMFSSAVTAIYMLFFNSKLYLYLKREKNKIWISNIFSTIIIQFFATIILILLECAITKKMQVIVGMILIRYFISIIYGIIGTIVIYLCNSIKEIGGNINENKKTRINK